MAEVALVYRLLADTVLVLHLGFIVFAAIGGLMALRSPGRAWLHLPALGWALWIVTSGGLCPLTPLEVELRQLAGGEGYEGGFIDHYVRRLIYPPGLTRGLQLGLAVGLGLLNLGIYALVLRRVRARRR